MPKSYEICLRLSAEEKERLEHSGIPLFFFV